MVKYARPHSPYAVEAAALLGAEIRLARRARGWSQEELAERVGVSDRTIRSIEQGGLGVALGGAFEAAALLGIPLFHAERSRLAADRESAAARAALLPRASRRRSPDDVDDDF